MAAGPVPVQPVSIIAIATAEAWVAEILLFMVKFPLIRRPP